MPATCDLLRSAASCTSGTAEIFQSMALRRTAGSVDCALIWSATSAIRADRLRPISKARSCSSLAERVIPGDDCMAGERVGTLAHAPTASAVTAMVAGRAIVRAHGRPEGARRESLQLLKTAPSNRPLVTPRSPDWAASRTIRVSAGDGYSPLGKLTIRPSPKGSSQPRVSRCL